MSAWMWLLVLIVGVSYVGVWWWVYEIREGLVWLWMRWQGELRR